MHSETAASTSHLLGKLPDQAVRNRPRFGAPASATAKRDAVQESGRVLLRDGRLVACRVYGDPAGRPIYFFHGFPGSHLQAAMVQAQAQALGIALVAFDRPGFGGSSPLAAATIESIARDTAEIADRLGHARFGVMGVSCGAPYALACARLMPERVSAVGLLGGIGPMDVPHIRKYQLPVLRALFGLARLHPWLAAPMFVLDWLRFRCNAERAVNALSSLLTLPDQSMLANDKAVRALFGASLARAYRQGVGGALAEARRIAGHGAATLAGIATRVFVFQAGDDRHVPPDMGRYLAAALANARLHFCVDEGHLSIAVNRFAQCARLVLGEH